MLPAMAGAQSTIRSDFDHDSTGFRLDGAHLASGCGDCHSRGVFDGTLRECEDCHSQGRLVTATPKPARHVLTSERCAACHATRSFIPLARMDHAEAFGDCVSCHNNQAVPGKPVDHPPAGDNCDACHLTSTFEVVVFGQSNLIPRRSRLPTIVPCENCDSGVVYDVDRLLEPAGADPNLRAER